MADHNLGPLPKSHPRDGLVHKAGGELQGFLLEWRKRHNLTSTEYMALVLGELKLSLGFMLLVERRQAEGDSNG